MNLTNPKLGDPSPHPLTHRVVVAVVFNRERKIRQVSLGLGLRKRERMKKHEKAHSLSDMVSSFVSSSDGGRPEKKKKHEVTRRGADLSLALKPTLLF